MKTWEEMFNYLKAQPNCSVRGKGFQVKDLHYTLNKYESMINLHDPAVRNRSVYCMSLKGSLERIFKAHREGNVFPVGELLIKPFATRID